MNKCAIAAQSPIIRHGFRSLVLLSLEALARLVHSACPHPREPTKVTEFAKSAASYFLVVAEGGPIRYRFYIREFESTDRSGAFTRLESTPTC